LVVFVFICYTKNINYRKFSFIFSCVKGHWRFPSGKEMQGYAYTLTHPGTPSVFYDHLFSHYKTEVSTLLSIRKRNKIHCRSTVSIRTFYYVLHTIV